MFYLYSPQIYSLSLKSIIYGRGGVRVNYDYNVFNDLPNRSKSVQPLLPQWNVMRGFLIYQRIIDLTQLFNTAPHSNPPPPNLYLVNFSIFLLVCNKITSGVHLSLFVFLSVSIQCYSHQSHKISAPLQKKVRTDILQHFLVKTAKVIISPSV